MSALKQNILGLDVAMDDTALVRVLKRIGNFAGNTQRIVNRKLLLALEPVSQ